ncbi:uncharacterized protein BDW47DRAFT_133618 [Aspergillus candidus]|uniref:RED-like N-terminal domain-containing protein n=1 Tax=Aspergillus candidus TaxID=41067 RepID=A0A2I2FKK1_ASPCN|nr:hypothetical protein BDW47DRAFT_133618 [Aspergillus candidus]PLB41156.1 hypothetical protein BDW47DRAFT_133618 [Aspergillus candidus]
MNNNQFRRLVLDTPNPSKARDGRSPGAPSTSPGAATGPAGSNALGSRLRPNIPMTPRNLQGVNFARQLAESRAGTAHPQKRFKSSSAPKGAKLPTGYQDRAAALRGQTADDEEAGKKEDVEARVRALEELVQKGELDRGTFEKLRAELGVGGDVGSTHLVKGLDWELLRRVKAGEDVDAPSRPPAEEEEKEEVVEDVDDALERALEEIPEGPVEKETTKTKKKGNMAPPRRSRDEILREFRASRAAAVAPPPEPALGDKFKRISAAQPEKQKQRFVEVDEATGRRREVLVITEADGKSKRKTRWLDPPGTKNPPSALLEPRKDAQPLGMAVPAEIAAKQAAAAAEDEDDDIFAGAGNDYNVADELGADESGSEDSEGEVNEDEKASASTDQPPPTTNEPARPRNYFSNTTTETPDEPDRSNPLTRDPTLLAALKRAAALRQAGEDGEDGGEGGNEEGVDAATALRRKKFLEEARRREAQDDADMDLGFGSSRIEDDEDEEGIVTVRPMCWGCCEDDNLGDDPSQGGGRLDQP